MDAKYPIGQFTCNETITHEDIHQWIQEIKLLPTRLSEMVKGLTDEKLEKTYRPGGWTVRQLVHHIADSHLNSYTRFKLALTEDNPTIKPYEEEKWALLVDSHLPISVSIQLIEALHERWVYLLESLTEEQLNRTFVHPDNGDISLKKNVGIYAWHGNHHLAHIQLALKEESRSI
ncbi:YfiT family bacillithiol transferase [Ureibacillus sp. 179-F W5.1 NHS]|uniref:YfiT family bacillithiol transferase n=1 Tax=Ureibacillus sp. 179-F W5.1 NHS TaxID=3374297 RepID=UPI00387A468A